MRLKFGTPFYDYKYAGIWQMDELDEAAKYGLYPGDVKIEDIHDPEAHKYSTNDRMIVGSPTPKWTAGLSNTVTYKGIDLTVFLDARWGHTLKHGILGWYQPSGGANTTNKNGPALIDYWTPENTGARFPQPREGANFANLPTGATSLFYVDGSYMKIRNITLGYSLPTSLLEKIRISKARIYATASNPFVFTKSKYLKDYDPERGGDDEFPIARQIVFGINVSF